MDDPATRATRAGSTAANRSTAVKRSTATRAPAARSRRRAAEGAAPATLAVDVGGSGVKAEVLTPDGSTIGLRQRIEVTYPCPPEQLLGYLTGLRDRLPPADRVAIGFPGMVRGGRVLTAPHFVTRSGPGSRVDEKLLAAWTGFALADAAELGLGLPVRVANDADVQGLSVIRGQGLELVLTLGTGMGSALFQDGRLLPHLELAHHPFRKGETYNEQIGDAARRRIGSQRWTKRVTLAVRTLRALTFYDVLYLGGGNASKLSPSFTEPAEIVDNVNGILGGLRLWDQEHPPA
jgi:polyphosphate glucokinase